MLALLLGFSPALQAAEPALTAPELFLALRRAGEDDPRATLVDAQRQVATAPDAATRFWLLLATGRMHGNLGDLKAARGVFAQAESILATVPNAGPHLSLWLQQESTVLDLDMGDPAQFGPRMKQLREKVNQLGDPVLSCSTTAWELWGLINTHNHDEAWLAAEQLEHCGHATGLRYLEAFAQAGMGLIKSRTASSTTDMQQVLTHFDRALAALGDGNFRMRRAGLE
ncbi:MAG: hypothetical protein IPJ08_05265 [Burkholderiales bacterium]|nr:hypothetical protein [Burkholderiales bacterium]MBP6677189.1 hypothetical protein [Vitreoscilla sp.]